jgi:hypothetical protein
LRPRICPPEESCEVIKVMTASRQSVESRRIVALEPQVAVKTEFQKKS